MTPPTFSGGDFEGLGARPPSSLVYTKYNCNASPARIKSPATRKVPHYCGGWTIIGPSPMGKLAHAGFAARVTDVASAALRYCGESERPSFDTQSTRSCTVS